MTSKKCSRCGATKEQGEFYSNGRGGKRNECRACTLARRPPGRDAAREAESRYRAGHRVELAERVQRWREEHPERWSEINVKAQQTWRAKHG